MRQYKRTIKYSRVRSSYIVLQTISNSMITVVFGDSALIIDRCKENKMILGRTDIGTIAKIFEKNF